MGRRFFNIEGKNIDETIEKLDTHLKNFGFKRLEEMDLNNVSKGETLIENEILYEMKNIGGLLVRYVDKNSKAKIVTGPMGDTFYADIMIKYMGKPNKKYNNMMQKTIGIIGSGISW
ncbi:hypothetical protein ACFL1H_07780 [Nanoarchaeota archaeon]